MLVFLWRAGERVGHGVNHPVHQGHWRPVWQGGTTCGIEEWSSTSAVISAQCIIFYFTEIKKKIIYNKAYYIPLLKIDGYIFTGIDIFVLLDWRC